MNKLIPVFLACGAIMILAGAVSYITGWQYSSYLFTVGATLFALAQINSFYRGGNKNLKRLYRQQLLGAFFILFAGALMFFSDSNEWILMLSIGAVLELYTAFRIPQEEKKDTR